MTREEAIKCLIDAKEEFALYHNHCDAFDIAIEALREEPRKKGKWIDLGGGVFDCSVCHERSCCAGSYCPDCGAKM